MKRLQISWLTSRMISSALLVAWMRLVTVCRFFWKLSLRLTSAPGADGFAEEVLRYRVHARPKPKFQALLDARPGDLDGGLPVGEQLQLVIAHGHSASAR